MTCEEFSNEFDVLYNNIASNKAPGINEYEKSVFLTKAQDEIIKSYFNPRTNKTQEGYDDNPRRQIDFSMITKSVPYKNVMYIINDTISALSNELEVDTIEEESDPNKKPELGEKIPVVKYENIDRELVASKKDIITVSSEGEIDKPISDLKKYSVHTLGQGDLLVNTLDGRLYSPFEDPSFDERPNTKAIEIEDDILMLINEYIIVKRGNDYRQVRLTVVPINYNEYSRLMSKAYKRPLKWQAWRLIDNSNNNKNYSELIVGVNDTIVQYSIRYVKRPYPILVDKFEDGLTVNGKSEPRDFNNPCELDPILHPEIVQRAVELAKAAYIGDLNSQIALGQSSETEKGIVTQNR